MLMNRIKGMTQDQTGGKTGWLRPGRIALAVAIIAAGFAIGLAVNRQGGGTASTSAEAGAAAIPADPVAELEARAKASPEDGGTQTALATAYFDTGRFADAVNAFGKAIEANPGAAVLWSSRGEARIMASPHDPMPREAVADFEKALSLNPKDPRARYFMAVKQDLAGDHKGALDAMVALLADTPPGAPWEADLRRTIEQIGKINGIDTSGKLAAVQQPAPALPMAARAIPGPSQADLANARTIPPGEQRDMAEGMVARLEGRLKGDPANVEGWIMLMRSRMTLGQPDKASQALKDALAANPGRAAFLREQAALLGIR